MEREGATRASRITSLTSSRICYGWVDCRLKLISFWRRRIFMNVSCRSLLRDNKLYDESLAWSLCKSETVLSVFRPRVLWHVGRRGRERERERETKTKWARNLWNKWSNSGFTECIAQVFHYDIYMVINWIRSIFLLFFMILIEMEINAMERKIFCIKYHWKINIRIFFFRHCIYVD